MKKGKKKKFIAVVGLCVAVGMASGAHAQNTMVNTYTCSTVSVTSSTTPVQLLAPGFMTRWTIHNRTGSTTSVLAFPYTGSVPASAPSGTMEVSPNAYLIDQRTCDSSTCANAIGEGWAGVLETGSTASTVDICYR